MAIITRGIDSIFDYSRVSYNESSKIYRILGYEPFKIQTFNFSHVSSPFYFIHNQAYHK